ncbi:MAG: acyl carrier protein [Vicinamibacteraceae bacterium]
MSTGLISHAELYERFASIVATSLRIDPSQVTREAYLDDLGAESLDLIEITMESENEFDVVMPERNIFDTAQEVLGPGVLETDGALTDEGHRLLRRRLPEIDASVLAETRSMADARKLFMRVDTWLRLIEALMEHSPRLCAACGAAREKSSPGSLRCPRCGSEAAIPSGDEINQRWVREYYEREYLASRSSAPGPLQTPTSIDEIEQRASSA